MEFCEFAQRMHKIIGGADNTAAFVKTLFENILLEKIIRYWKKYP